MILVVLTVGVVVLLAAVLAICLFAIGIVLNRVAENLTECANNVVNICRHAAVIGPAVTRLNRSAGDLAGAAPLLYDGAESLLAATATPAPDPEPEATEPAGVGVGYLDR
jgi:hypothetical protein